MPKANKWSDSYDCDIEISIRGSDTVLIDIEGSEFECDSTDAREIGQKLIEMADQFDE